MSYRYVSNCKTWRQRITSTRTCRRRARVCSSRESWSQIFVTNCGGQIGNLCASVFARSRGYNITFAPPTTQSSWSNHRRLDSNSLRFGVDYASYVNEKQSLFGCMSPRIITRNENLYSPDIVIAVVILANKPLNTTKILKTRNTFCRTRSLSNATFSFLITWRPPSSKSAAVYKISLKSDDFYRASAYWRAILI